MGMMIDFNKISVNQIAILSEIIAESSLLGIEFIRQKYLNDSSNFEITIEFLKDLKLIDIVGNEIILKNKCRELLKKIKNTKKPDQVIRNFILDIILNSQSIFTSIIKDFLSNFNVIEDRLEFTPSRSQRLKYSGLRNFFMDLGVLYLDVEGNKYIISDIYSLVGIETEKHFMLPIDKFYNLQRSKEEIGKAAELEIIQYEKDRLSSEPYLANKIEHMSLKDVSAGYDIKSFNKKYEDLSNPIPRFIEVKAVSRHNYKFMWTRNEIEKAKYYRNNYYLYLLPVLNKNNFEINNIKIIKDPYTEVFHNEDEWRRSEELFSFSFKETETS